MKSYNFLGRHHILIEKEDFKRIKVIKLGHRFFGLPLNSRIRKFLVKLCGVRSRFHMWFRKLIGRPIPLFEIACNPEIKLQEIKDRRFYFKK